MNKIILAGVIATTATVFAFAEEGGAGKPMPPVKAIKAVLATSTKPAMAGEGIPFTGDKAIDDQIKALVKERDAKLKAIHEEFQAKLKQLIGDKKTLRASTTEKMKEMRDEMKDRMKNASGTMMNGTGTPTKRMPPQASGTPTDLMKRPGVPQQPNNALKRFFQSFLGSPQTLQAEETQ